MVVLVWNSFFENFEETIRNASILDTKCCALWAVAIKFAYYDLENPMTTHFRLLIISVVTQFHDFIDSP